MKTVSSSEFRKNASSYLDLVEKGEEVVVCRRNVPVARLEPVKTRPGKVNRSTLGSMKGTVQILSDLTEPFIPENEWDMLK